MRPTDNIKHLIETLNIKAGAELGERTIRDAMTAQPEAKIFNPAQSTAGIWRIITKSRITKVAVATDEIRIEKSNRQGLTPFIVLGLILLVCKVVEVLPGFSSGILFRLIPLFFVLVFFIFFLKQNPLKITENPYSEGEIE